MAPETNLPSPIDRRDKSLLVVIGADVVTVVPSAVRKSESLRGKSHSYREGDTRKQHLHDDLPFFLACIIRHPSHSFCDGSHELALSLSALPAPSFGQMQTTSRVEVAQTQGATKGTNTMIMERGARPEALPGESRQRRRDAILVVAVIIVFIVILASAYWH